MINKDNERNIIQILRAVAICMVVFHHIANALPSDSTIKSMVTFVNLVHVVVFFVISGWLFEKNKGKYTQQGILTFLKNKALQLLIPYIIFSFSFAFIIYFMQHVNGLSDIATSLVDGKEKSFLNIVLDIIVYRDVYFESLWFVYCLFILMFFMYLLKNDRFIRPSMTLFYMMVMMVIKAYAWMVFDIEQFAMLDYIILYFPWIMFGRCLYKYTQGGGYSSIFRSVCSLFAVYSLS